MARGSLAGRAAVGRYPRAGTRPSGVYHRGGQALFLTDAAGSPVIGTAPLGHRRRHGCEHTWRERPHRGLPRARLRNPRDRRLRKLHRPPSAEGAGLHGREAHLVGAVRERGPVRVPRRRRERVAGSARAAAAGARRPGLLRSVGWQRRPDLGRRGERRQRRALASARQPPDQPGAGRRAAAHRPRVQRQLVPVAGHRGQPGVLHRRVPARRRRAACAARRRVPVLLEPDPRGRQPDDQGHRELLSRRRLRR